MGRTKRPQVALYLDPEVIEMLGSLARRLRVSKQELLRRAVNNMLLQQKTPSPPGYEWVRERLPDGGGNRFMLRKKLPSVDSNCGYEGRVIKLVKPARAVLNRSTG
jgi:hypothetical protein